MSPIPRVISGPASRIAPAYRIKVESPGEPGIQKWYGIKDSAFGGNQYTGSDVSPLEVLLRNLPIRCRNRRNVIHVP